MRIVFFIECLRSGGKERRMLELVRYISIKTDIQINLVLMDDEIHYDYIHHWNIPITIMKRKKLKKDPRIFWKFYSFCKEINPDIIHAWSFMSTFYAIPTKIVLKIPLLSSMIASGNSQLKPRSLDKFYFKMNCFFSDIIFSNSKAGLEAYRLDSKKAKIIYNGFDLERFEKMPDTKVIRKLYNINTPFMAVMVASMIDLKKDYDLFLDVAKYMSNIRNDITFVGVGGGVEFHRILLRIKNEKMKNILLLGQQKEIESIVSASDIGILFSNVKIHKEGISNSIMEYMALGKPVIATDAGGTKELIEQNKTGYLITNENIQDICDKISYLLDNPMIRLKMGEKGRSTIKEKYTIDKMGDEFIKIYDLSINKN